MTNVGIAHGSTTETERSLEPWINTTSASALTISMPMRKHDERTSFVRTPSDSAPRKSRRKFSCGPPSRVRAGYDRKIKSRIISKLAHHQHFERGLRGSCGLR